MQGVGHWASGSGGLIAWDKLTIYQGSKFHTLYLCLVSFPEFKYGGCTRVLRVWEQDYELTGTKWLMRNIPQLRPSPTVTDTEHQLALIPDGQVCVAVVLIKYPV